VSTTLPESSVNFDVLLVWTFWVLQFFRKTSDRDHESEVPPRKQVVPINIVVHEEMNPKFGYGI
jgi:hypothetical protein